MRSFNETEGSMQWFKGFCRKGRLTQAIAAAVVATVGLSGLAQAGDGPFDWSIPSDTAPGYTPAPFLTDANASSVASFFNSELASNPNAVLAVKVNQPLTGAGLQVFNNFNVKYVFADYEGSTAVSFTRALADNVKASSKSPSAFISNFNLYSVPNDPTRTGSPNTGAANSFSNIFGGTDYNASGVTMSSPAAYPGSPDFVYKNPNPNAVGQQFPSLRTAFFVLPIDRVTFTTTSLPAGQANIPWVSRFNVWGNNQLNNAPNFTDSATGTTYQYAFNTNDPAHPEYANQLPSAGDFSAQMLHDRLRGASSYNLFNYSTPASSVIGYSAAQERTDASNGWNAAGNATVNGIFSRNNYKIANLINQVPISPGQYVWSAYSGMVLSGVYDQSGANRQLALLLSNMAPTAQTVDFFPQYGGASIDLNSNNGSGTATGQFYTIAPGTHHLLEFNLVGSQWVAFADDSVFADANRNGVGVPEPTSLALLGLGGFGLLLRRRARRA
ncbi:MAG TPA: PEP-CTERM sorting domain-containing protein [Tepidisphaeraceae bacterium]|nr:PEP-CTERM sorting domain-containing protein [Tepidisphaeraceae bacterium]